MQIYYQSHAYEEMLKNTIVLLKSKQEKTLDGAGNAVGKRCINTATFV